MHRHKRFQHGPKPFRGIFWLFLLAMFFLRGHWWPGILVLIGLSIVFGSLFREGRPPAEPQNLPQPYAPMMPPAPLRPVPPPVEQIHRIDLLPANCSQCGGPIRSHEVTWTGKQSAACPYCNSNLPMKKG